MNANMRRTALVLLVTTGLAITNASSLTSQSRRPQHRPVSFGSANYLILPQSRAFAFQRRSQPIRIESVRARVTILEQTARTTLDITLRNPSRRQEEAVLLLPVPRDSAVSGFAFDGKAAEPTARLLSREEARRTYDGIVRRLKDPALLEFAGHSLIRSSVFPVPAGGTQRIRLTYENVLKSDGARVDYVLARSESLEHRAPWQIDVTVTSKKPISMVYSPSHDLEIKRVSKRQFTVKLNKASRNQPGSFLFSYLTERGDGMTASLFAYPDPKIGGGYFLLVAGLPATDKKERVGLRREVTIVLDRSGSMAGTKMDQVRAAALQVIEGLADGEGFNIIDYATTVGSFASKPVTKNRSVTLDARKYLASLRSNGGTNIHDALLEAMRPKPMQGTLPIILFLTDGLPTVGSTSEAVIRDLVAKGNKHERRIFTFGVGNDVNVPLLDAVAENTRAMATYVQPKEDVEVKVAEVFRKLYGPVLDSPELVSLDSDGKPSTRRVSELHPSKLTDLFENDQFVILGQYKGEAPLKFRLKGNFLGKPRVFAFEFTLDKATTRNSFVPRLWASRRIAYLVDQIRQAGAARNGGYAVRGQNPFDDPKFVELRDEIMRLSTEFGVLSEYTAFLATEGTVLTWNELLLGCEAELNSKAIQKRSGKWAVNQGINIQNQKHAYHLNRRNGFLNDKLERVETSTVIQVCDRAFFKRGKTWIDGRLLRSGEYKAKRQVVFGSDEYRQLLAKLVRRGRQATMSLSGSILIKVDGEVIRVVNDQQGNMEPNR